MPSPVNSSTTPIRNPDTPASSERRIGGTSPRMLVASSGSCPATASSRSTASPTVRARGPIWSSEEAKAISPYRLTSP